MKINDIEWFTFKPADDCSMGGCSEYSEYIVHFEKENSTYIQIDESFSPTKEELKDIFFKRLNFYFGNKIENKEEAFELYYKEYMNLKVNEYYTKW